MPLPVINADGTPLAELLAEHRAVRHAAEQLCAALDAALPLRCDFPDRATHQAARDDWTAARDGALFAIRWADIRLVALARQNRKPDGDKAGVVVGQERRPQGETT